MTVNRQIEHVEEETFWREEDQLEDPRRWTGDKAKEYEEMRKKVIPRMVELFRLGFDRGKINGNPNVVKLRSKYVAAMIEEWLQEAEATVSAERQANERELASKLEAGLAKFTAHTHGPDTVHADLLARVENAIRFKTPQTTIDKYNAALKAQKSGPITYNDVAFCACVHRISILKNGSKNGSNFKDTGPFKRIRKAAATFDGREKPLDHRQIRAALTLLESLGFTEEIAPAVHSYDDPKGNRAGLWTLTNDPYWVSLFDAKTTSTA